MRLSVSTWRTGNRFLLYSIELTWVNSYTHCEYLYFSESIVFKKPNMFSKAWKHNGHWSVVRVTYRQNFKYVIDLLSLFWININFKKCEILEIRPVMTDWLDTLSLALMKMSPDFHVSAHCLTQEVIQKWNSTSVFLWVLTRTQKHIKSMPHCTWVSVLSWQRGGVRQETIQDKDECSRL